MEPMKKNIFCATLSWQAIACCWSPYNVQQILTWSSLAATDYVEPTRAQKAQNVTDHIDVVDISVSRMMS